MDLLLVPARSHLLPTWRQQAWLSKTLSSQGVGICCVAEMEGERNSLLTGIFLQFSCIAQHKSIGSSWEECVLNTAEYPILK